MFVRSLLRSIKSKLGEPILIIVTVAFAVATFVSALSLGSSIETGLRDSYKALSGNAALEATFADDFSAYYTTANSLEFEALQEATAPYGKLHAGYYFYASTTGKSKEFARMYATDLSDFVTYRSVDFAAGGASDKNTAAILGESFAEKLGVSVGDRVKLTMYGSAKATTVEVVGVSEGTGAFRAADILVSEVTATRLFSFAEDVKVYNRFFIELSEENMKLAAVTEEQAAAKISELAPAFSVASPVNDENVAVTLRNESTLLFVIAALVAVLGVVLIYTAVSLVMKNRMKLAALFRSVGATSGGLCAYLLAEIALYGVVGGVLGVAGSLGLGALFNLIVGGAGATVTLTLGYAVLGVAFGVVLATLSALVPVLRVSRMPLYDMLNVATPVVKYGWLSSCITGAAFVAFFLWSVLSGVSDAFVAGIFAAAALFAFLFAVVPLLVKGAGKLLMKCSRESNAGALYIAASGAKENRHAFSGARLLCIAITAVIVVASLSGEATTQLNGFERLFRADLMISANEAEIPTLLADVRTESNVEGAYAAYIETQCPLAQGENTVTLIAVRAQEIASALDTEVFRLNASSIVGVRRAALSEGLAMKLGVSLGDSFAVKVNGAFVDFTVASYIDTPLTMVFTDLSGLDIPANVCLVRGTSDTLADDLAEKYALTASVYRVRDAFGYVMELADAYIQVFVLLDIVVILFAFLGYFNNALASYRDRKKEYALLESVGASRADRRKMIVAENALVVLVAAVLAGIASVALLFIVQNMLKSLGLYFRLLG